MSRMTVVPASETSTAKPTAVIYLRVSTREQAQRGGEVEGFSIPAQREACLRKAETLGAQVVEQFIDAGESARSANRPDLQRMLAYVQEIRPTFAIVHKVDRLARNRVDDVEINVVLTASGVQLVSCTENIDETPSGMLLHGIMSSIAEFYSRNLATEARKGMRQKAKNGGTPGMAPFGYINTRERTEDGHEVRTVALDPDRATWVGWMYERYATGEWTTGMLHDELDALGIISLPRPNRPSGPLSKSHIAGILQNRYYAGVVTFEGAEYPGKHQALVSHELFDKVQRVRLGRVQSREKPRVHTHFLKGSIYCGECGEPLSLEISRNRAGEYYDYFYCLGRQHYKNGCTFKATQVHVIERSVEDHWATVTLHEDHVREIQALVWDHIREVLPSRRAEESDATQRIKKLEYESQKLLQAHFADAIPIDLLKREQARIAAGRAAVEEVLRRTQLSESRLEQTLEDCCRLLAEAGPRRVRVSAGQEQFEDGVGVSGVMS